jgi:hypothetical protein
MRYLKYVVIDENEMENVTSPKQTFFSLNFKNKYLPPIAFNSLHSQPNDMNFVLIASFEEMFVFAEALKMCHHTVRWFDG